MTAEANGFVVAAYAMTWLLLGGYGLSLWRRQRALSKLSTSPAHAAQASQRTV